jgi:uncharacterized protein (UPF0332 family)
MREVESLMQRAKRAITSAELLLKDGDFETSISRSYYAMFYAVEALLLTKGLDFHSHRSVISLFSDNFVKTGIFKREMGKKLSKTLKKRLLSDYSFAPHIDEKDAKESLSWAGEFVKEIEEYLTKEGLIK